MHLCFLLLWLLPSLLLPIFFTLKPYCLPQFIPLQCFSSIDLPLAFFYFFISLVFLQDTHIIWCCLYAMPEQSSCLLICKFLGFFLLYLQGNKMLLLPWCAATDTTCSPSLKHFLRAYLHTPATTTFSSTQQPSTGATTLPPGLSPQAKCHFFPCCSSLVR